MSLCLAAGAAVAVLAAESFTLGWTHSIEQLRWEEDWRIEAGRLALREARMRGTGAGMEPPPGAVLREGVWHFRPTSVRLGELRLSASGYTPDYELCWGARCRALAEVLPRRGDDAVVLTACDPGAPGVLALDRQRGRTNADGP